MVRYHRPHIPATGWHGFGISGIALAAVMLGTMFLLFPAEAVATPAAVALHRELTYRDAPDIRYLREPQFSGQQTEPPAPPATGVRRVPSPSAPRSREAGDWSIPISRSLLLDFIHFAALGTLLCLWWAWSKNTP